MYTLVSITADGLLQKLNEMCVNSSVRGVEVNRLIEVLNLSEQAVRSCLRELRKAGLVRAYKLQGSTMWALTLRGTSHVNAVYSPVIVTSRARRKKSEAEIRWLEAMHKLVEITPASMSVSTRYDERGKLHLLASFGP
jgi:predicted ArsR family transcriptional regulator